MKCLREKSVRDMTTARRFRGAATAVRAKLAGRAGQRGETLVEVLVAVLVSAMAMLMLAMAISVGSNLVSKNNTMTTEYYGHIDNLVTMSSNTSTVTAYQITGDGTYVDDGTVSSVTYVSETLPGAEVAVAYKQSVTTG